MRALSLLQSLSCALAGFLYCLKTQRNMKIHGMAAILVGMAAWWYELTADEVVVLLLTIGLVITLEMVNTAVETVVNLVSPDYHHLAKIAKDVAAGAVFIAALTALAVGYYLFFDRIFG